MGIKDFLSVPERCLASSQEVPSAGNILSDIHKNSSYTNKSLTISCGGKAQ